MSIRRAYADRCRHHMVWPGFGLILSASTFIRRWCASGSFGVNPDGLAGLAGRVVDYMSAFTDLSNIVAIVLRCLLETPTGVDAYGTRCAWTHW